MCTRAPQGRKRVDVEATGRFAGSRWPSVICYFWAVPKKSSNINIRISDDVKDAVDFLKLCPGGLTKYIEDALRQVPIDYALLNAWRSNREKK